MNQTKKIRYLLLGTLLLSALSFDMGQAADISPAKPAANAGLQVEKPGKAMGMRKRQPYSMEEKSGFSTASTISVRMRQGIS